jgi:hypothetical protein
MLKPRWTPALSDQTQDARPTGGVALDAVDGGTLREHVRPGEASVVPVVGPLSGTQNKGPSDGGTDAAALSRSGMELSQRSG